MHARKLSGECIRGTSALMPDVDDSQKEVLHLLDRLCIPHERRHPHYDGYAWDGKTIATGMPSLQVLHDACHYLVCPVERRSIPDFGLGTGPGSRNKSKPVMHWLDGEMEEIQALILTGLYQLHLGHEPTELKVLGVATLNDGVYFYSVDNATIFWHNLVQLDEKGLLNCHILHESNALQQLLLLLGDESYKTGSIEELLSKHRGKDIVMNTSD